MLLMLSFLEEILPPEHVSLSNENEEYQTIGFASLSGNASGLWYFDSGCSRHMTFKGFKKDIQR